MSILELYYNHKRVSLEEMYEKTMSKARRKRGYEEDAAMKYDIEELRNKYIKNPTEAVFPIKQKYLYHAPGGMIQIFGIFCKLQSYSSQLFTVLGNGITSRILPMPVRYITQRSKPRPKPE